MASPCGTSAFARGAAPRGTGSSRGCRVDINRYVTNQEFLGLKSFSLDNMYSDSSLVRESVTMKMFERMELPASREAHARLFVNNEYAGAYVIIEAIDRTFIERAVRGRGSERRTRRVPVRIPMDLAVPSSTISGPGSRPTRRCSNPRRRDTDSIANLYAPLEEMIRTINESADDDFAAAVGKYLDLEPVHEVPGGRVLHGRMRTGSSASPA